MSAVVADAHVVIWMLFTPEKLSANALASLNGAVQAGEPIYISSVSVIEVIYLVEKGRIPQAVLLQLFSELTQPNSGLRVVPVDLAIAQTIQTITRSAVPEMPDRIIAATALYLGVPLVTRDLRILATSLSTTW